MRINNVEVEVLNKILFKLLQHFDFSKLRNLKGVESDGFIYSVYSLQTLNEDDKQRSISIEFKYGRNSLNLIDITLKVAYNHNERVINGKMDESYLSIKTLEATKEKDIQLACDKIHDYLFELFTADSVSTTNINNGGNQWLVLVLLNAQAYAEGFKDNTLVSSWAYNYTNSTVYCDIQHTDWFTTILTLSLVSDGENVCTFTNENNIIYATDEPNYNTILNNITAFLNQLVK